MRKFVAVSVATVALALPAMAPASGPTLNWGSEVNAGKCDVVGTPVVDVTQKIVNSIDSGFHGYWAYVNYNKHIQLRDQGDGTYCAVVSYQGKFSGEEGQLSPGDGNPLTGSESGTFQGGYRAVITGTLLASPTAPTHGNLGTANHECDIVTAVCPGQTSYLADYFQEGSNLAYSWWGWIYRGGRNGVWVNAQTGSSGDIS